MIVVRYADVTIVGFQRHADTDRFLRELRARLAAFSLDLHPDKTQLIEFGRFAAQRRSVKGLSKPETFYFLGLAHCPRQSRIASPELLPSSDLLPHVICSPPVLAGGGEHEADQYDDT